MAFEYCHINQFPHISSFPRWSGKTKTISALRWFFIYYSFRVCMSVARCLCACMYVQNSTDLGTLSLALCLHFRIYILHFGPDYHFSVNLIIIIIPSFLYLCIYRGTISFTFEMADNKSLNGSGWWQSLMILMTMIIMIFSFFGMRTSTFCDANENNIIFRWTIFKDSCLLSKSWMDFFENFQKNWYLKKSSSWPWI